MRTERRETIALFDIGAANVAGALVSHRAGERGLIVYSCSTPIDQVAGETAEAALVRSLVAVVRSVRDYGEAALERGGHEVMPSRAVVSLEAPWQETRSETTHLEADEPFELNKEMLARLMRDACVPRGGRVYTEAVVSGAVLEGYAVRAPLGRRTRDAYVHMLTSDVATEAYELIEAALALYIERERITLISGTALRLEALRTLLPHEDELTVLDAMGEMPRAARVRKGVAVALDEARTVEPADAGDQVHASLTSLALRHPLSATLVLLARAEDALAHTAHLERLPHEELWLTGARPRILAIDPHHLKHLVGQHTHDEASLALMLMAVYALY